MAGHRNELVVKDQIYTNIGITIALSIDLLGEVGHLDN